MMPRARLSQSSAAQPNSYFSGARNRALSAARPVMTKMCIRDREETAARKAALAGGCIELPLPEEEMQNFRQLVQPLYRKYCADYLPLVEEIQAE